MAVAQSFRRAERVMMTRAATELAEKEWPFTVTLVPMLYLMVDESYQRPRQERFITKMTAAFDPTLVGVLDVSARRDDRFAILDGRQRYSVMEKVGKTAVWCAVYENMTVRDEAAFFHKKNHDRKNMKPYYSFRAMVVAGDVRAVQILGILHSEGFDIGPVTNDSEIVGSVRACEEAFSYKSDHRSESLTPALSTIRDAFFGRTFSTHSEVIKGLGKFWQAFADDEVERDRLVGVLGNMGPHGLRMLARDRMMQISWRAASAVAAVALEEYNKVDRKGRLDAKRLMK